MDLGRIQASEKVKRFRLVILLPVCTAVVL